MRKFSIPGLPFTPVQCVWQGFAVFSYTFHFFILAALRGQQSELVSYIKN
jgi:hypothetical protein